MDTHRDLNRSPGDPCSTERSAPARPQPPSAPALPSSWSRAWCLSRCWSVGSRCGQTPSGDPCVSVCPTSTHCSQEMESEMLPRPLCTQVTSCSGCHTRPLLHSLTPSSTAPHVPPAWETGCAWSPCPPPQPPTTPPRLLQAVQADQAQGRTSEGLCPRDSGGVWPTGSPASGAREGGVARKLSPGKLRRGWARLPGRREEGGSQPRSPGPSHPPPPPWCPSAFPPVERAHSLLPAQDKGGCSPQQVAPVSWCLLDAASSLEDQSITPPDQNVTGKTAPKAAWQGRQP